MLTHSKKDEMRNLLPSLSIKLNISQDTIHLKCLLKNLIDESRKSNIKMTKKFL